jgi:serine/threonine protein kinase
VTADRPVPSSLSAGDRIGRDLTVLGTLGEGSGGHVYAVWHHAAWCPMACKVFAEAWRARAEARALAAMRHPNIARFLGLATSRAILLEFLEGPSLRRLLRERPRHRLSLSDAMRLGIHIGAALTHMHQRGFLHLDVKPSNILVVRGRPVLVDFGTARPRTVTRLARPEGTDPYMAPEQCEGGSLGPASDVFGFGVLLHEILAGRRPFPAPTEGQPFPQTVKPPVPLRRHLPRIPPGLEALLRRCLARDPARRPASPAALLPALHRFIRRGPPMWPPGLTLDTDPP